MSIPRISVELTEDKKKMTVEWHRWLSTLAAGSAGPATQTGEVSLAQFNALQALVNAQTVVLQDYEKRLHALEIGYQS